MGLKGLCVVSVRRKDESDEASQSSNTACSKMIQIEKEILKLSLVHYPG